MSMTAGDVLKEEGKASVRNANRAFVDTMREEAKIISDARGWVCSDDLRAVAKVMQLEPNHPNAWGSVFGKAGWTCIGYMKSELPSNHSRIIAKWVAK